MEKEQIHLQGTRVGLFSVLFKANLKMTTSKWSTFVTNASSARSLKGRQYLCFYEQSKNPYFPSEEQG